VTIVCEIKVAFPPRGNSDWSGWKRHRIVSAQRKAVAYAVLCKTRAVDRTLPMRCTLTRLCQRLVDSHDNLPFTLKSAVDSIAELWGAADNDPGFEWKYLQEKCKRGEAGLRIAIEVNNG
jgi:hypothetical protein